MTGTAKHESFDEFVSKNKADKEKETVEDMITGKIPIDGEEVKKYCCPICKGDIDLEHYAFVLEVMKDPKKQEAWRKKEYTFEMWQEEHK